MVGNRFNIESAPEFVNILSWTKSFRLAQCGKQRLPGATIGALSVFLVRMMNSRIGFDWRDLEVFVAAAESGSIARAAERCRLAPSAASKRLSDLEAALGAPLLERPVRMIVHGPGVAVVGGILDAPTAALVDAVNIKVGGLLRLVRAVDGHLVKGSRLVAIGGHYGFEPTAYAAAAGVANAALMNAVRQLSLAYGERGITAHLIAPGPADTF